MSRNGAKQFRGLYINKIQPGVQLLHNLKNYTMSLHKYRERLRTLDCHIKTNSLGNAENLAFKLGLSTAGTYKFLEEVKQEGFPIKYSRKEKRFYYDPKGKMIGYVFVKDTDDTDDE